MPTSVILYKKGGDGRLWMDASEELAPGSDIGVFRSRLPIMRGTKDKYPSHPLGAVSSHRVFFDQEGRRYYAGDHQELIKLLDALTEDVKGIDAVSISRYTLTVDKTRAVKWSKIIPQLKDVISNITGMSVDLEDEEDFLAAAGELVEWPPPPFEPGFI